MDKIAIFYYQLNENIIKVGMTYSYELLLLRHKRPNGAICFSFRVFSGKNQYVVWPI